MNPDPGPQPTALQKVRADVVAHVRDNTWEVVFGIAFLIAIIVDLALVLSGHTSISATIWNLTQEHPTLIAFGILLTIGACWLLRGSWPAVMMAGILGGHLFVHW